MKGKTFFDYIPFGGDFNPDQWPRDVWEKDLDLLKEAGVNLLTLPVFSWAKLQPSENSYDFSWLDEILDVVAQKGMKICLATPTAAQPAWMSLRYPDILPVDIQGRKRTHGKRINFCPNSPSYRKFSAAVAEKMALRYKDHPALVLWHVSNEYGTLCYCETCASKFRQWLEKRYQTVENLNARWNLSFWGHTVYTWDEVTVPSQLNDDDTCSPAKALDYKRFMTDSLIDCYQNEREVIRKISPDIPATTNYTGFIDKIDLSRIAEVVDVVGWDHYPAPTEDRSIASLKHEIMRGLKGGAPYLMMEQSPNQQNWQPYNMLKRPGEVRRMSYQALGRGSDAVLFFQMKASRGGIEKFHGAFIGHDGGTDTRIYREMSQLGQELHTLGNRFVGAETKAKAAIIFEWDNWWALELSSGPSCDLKYFDQVNAYYKTFYNQNIAVDIVRGKTNLDKYDLVIAPVLYMLRDSVAQNLAAFVSEGGILVTTFFSGIVDENDLITDKGFPGGLRSVTGIRAEEIDALPPGKTNTIILSDSFRQNPGSPSFSQDAYTSTLLCDIIHGETAEVLASYGDDFYAGKPCLTKNAYGKGQAYYLATAGDAPFMEDFTRHVLREAGISPVLEASEGVEVAERVKEGRAYSFIINHSAEEGIVGLSDKEYTDLLSGEKCFKTVKIAPGDVRVLESRERM